MVSDDHAPGLRCPRILYIMGTARSGSTILEILLANNPGVVGAGELTHIFQDGFLDRKPCSCGERIPNCEQWAPVYEAFKGGLEVWSAHALLLQAVEWHREFWRTLMQWHSRETWRSYRALNESLFEALRDHHDVRWVVDSSKYAGRALALSRTFSEQTWVICLTRSPRGLIHAFSKPNPKEQKAKSVIAVLGYYLGVLTCLKLTAALLGRRVFFMRYEDLLADPGRCLSELQDWCGLDLSQVRARLRDNDTFAVGHVVTGNRLRKLGRVRFQAERERPAASGITASFVAALMNGYRRVLGF